MNKLNEIDKLYEDAVKCKCQKTCYGPGSMKICVPKPDKNFGRENIKVLFINERPGRIGTGNSGKISMHNNDPSARFFKECFELLGLKEHEIFSTNACLCYPSNLNYRDKAPKSKAIKNCSFWLKKQIDILKPMLIVTLGNTALCSIKYLYGSNDKSLKKFKLKPSLGDVIACGEFKIYPLYHTSARARITRKAEEQKNDWKKIPKILREIKNQKTKLKNPC